MDPDAVVALARAALFDLRPDEARAIATALEPLLARLEALPSGTAEGAPTPDEQVLRADVPGPALPPAAALAGVPAVTPSGLVQVGRPRGRS